MAGAYCAIGNGTKPNPYAGDPVHVQFSSTAAAIAPQQMIITDANGQVRTLKSFERLILRALIGDVSAGHVEVANSSTLASSTLVASFGQNNGQFTAEGEGFSLPIGVTPWIINNASSSTASINISGNASIVEGTTQGTRPSWRESQNGPT